MTDGAERTASWQPGRKPEPGEVWQRVPQAGETLASRFRLIRTLGAGGSGVVFEAEDLKLRQRVAVKIIHGHLAESRALERLRREVRAARGGHAHAAAVYDLHEWGGLRFLTMELVEGECLKAVLAERGRLEVGEAVPIGRQIAAALAFLHGRGLVHRDIKPSNILLAGKGEALAAGEVAASTVKVCDLGLVRSLEDGVTVTESAMVVGTPAYMAPEQATGPELTPASDVYALGLLLWECLAGEPPLKADAAVATLVKRQSSRSPWLRSRRPDAPSWLARLLAARLDPQPRRRPSAAEVERALASGQVRRRPPWRQLAATLAVLLATGAGLVGWRALARGATVRVEVVEREVAGFDARGRTAWRYALDNPVQQVERADLHGDGVEDVLVAAFPAQACEGGSDLLSMSEFLIVTRTGHLLTRIRPEQLVLGCAHPFPLRLALGIKLADVDGDGAPEVLLNARQRSFFPNQVLLYWPRHGVWDWLVDHSGALDDCVAVPGQPGQVAIIGVNNRLGMQPVLGVWSVVPPDRRRGAVRMTAVLRSPDNGSLAGPISRWLSYVPLGLELWKPDGDGIFKVEPGQDGGFELAVHGRRTRLDRFGNPEGSPNWGRDLLAQRLEFLARTTALRQGSAVGSRALVEEEVARLEGEMAPLLAEPPYRAILALASSRAFVRSGAAVRAREVLLPAVANEDVAFRLANLEALSGERAAALARTWRLVDNGRSPRAGFDGLRLLLDLAAEDRNAVELERVIGAWRNVLGPEREVHSGAVPAFWARARLWWDEATPADGSVTSWAYMDEGEAVACLVRWRLGQSTAADTAAMEHYLEAGYEGAPLGRAALAAVQLATGASGDALHQLDRLVNELQGDATWDLRTRQYLHLARPLRAHALSTVGRHEQGRVEAERLLAESGPGLLPAILAREVLDRL